ncbi:hypothetical protein [Microbispora sp. H10670]|uniref:hypothetical protein n=1 Tax=Microbispora sp. H10670 TaxID=2729108 RepID=UPI0016010022|nr:hypothetical protein [Microbispora sp. H10670]
MRVNSGRPQLYGTQFYGDSDGSYPIEGVEHLDERRAAVGLDPFAEYKATMRGLDVGDERAWANVLSSAGPREPCSRAGRRTVADCSQALISFLRPGAMSVP